MLFSVNDLTGFTAHADDFSAAIVDVFVARDSLQISHLAIDIGGWLSNRTIVITADKLSGISPADRSVALQVTKLQAQGATVLDAAGFGGGLKLGDIPQLILGPSRNDVSHAFLARNAAGDQYLSATATTGSVASNGQDALGKVIGLIAQSDTLAVSHLAIDTGTGLPETQRVVPIALVDRLGDADNMTVLKTDAGKLKDSPQLEEFDTIDRHWLDKVASYYGLS